MNKTAIKNFAVWARRKLISEITYKAGLLGITEKGIAEPLPQSTKDLQFFDVGTKDYTSVSGNEITQRNALVWHIKQKGNSSDYNDAFRSVVEETAYTWFNRLIAIRFMEVNDYLPSRIRVLSSENPAKLEPDFVTTPFDTDLEFSAYERDRVMQLKDENKLQGFNVDQRKEEVFKAKLIQEFSVFKSLLFEIEDSKNFKGNIANILKIPFVDSEESFKDYELESIVYEEKQLKVLGLTFEGYKEISKQDFNPIWGNLLNTTLYTQTYESRLVYSGLFKGNF